MAPTRSTGPVSNARGGTVVELRRERLADAPDGLGIDVAGQRDGVGHEAGLVARHAAKQAGGLGHGQLRQHDGRDLGAFLFQHRQQAVLVKPGYAIPRVRLGRGPGEPAQAACGGRADVAVHDRERTLDAAGKGEADLVQLVQEFLDHGPQRGAIDKPHLADLFGQSGLHVFGKRREGKLRSLGEQQAHDHGRLDAAVQRLGGAGQGGGGRGPAQRRDLPE